MSHLGESEEEELCGSVSRETWQEGGPPGARLVPAVSPERGPQAPVVGDIFPLRVEPVHVIPGQLRQAVLVVLLHDAPHPRLVLLQRFP